MSWWAGLYFLVAGWRVWLFVGGASLLCFQRVRWNQLFVEDDFFSESNSNQRRRCLYLIDVSHSDFSLDDEQNMRISLSHKHAEIKET